MNEEYVKTAYKMGYNNRILVTLMQVGTYLVIIAAAIMAFQVVVKKANRIETIQYVAVPCEATESAKIKIDPKKLELL